MRDRGERKGQGYEISCEIEGRGRDRNMIQVERREGEEGTGISYRLRDRGKRKGQGYDKG